MELLARERAAEQNVHYYLKATDEPIVSLLQAFEEYRQACQASVFADFESNFASKGRSLWHAHTEGKKYFHRNLAGLRKQPNGQQVAIRQLIKFYLLFLKESQRFYRDYIYKLNTAFGGIPELQTVAHQVKSDASGESSQASISPSLRQKVLESCHQTLIYLGDLSRYRASEKLDKNPDFGPAIGYYNLACTLVPSSGMGYHQLAVVELEQHQHLKGIYYLYRAMVVKDPHPNAANNLKLEFDKTNTAWDRGELIPKGPPNDPEAPKRMLIGWFVRLHSMCFKSEAFRGYDELEREVLGQLGMEIRRRALDNNLMRMIMVNFAAQYNAGENFQENPIQQNQDSFYRYFRINIKTFTTLLQVFYDDLKNVDLTTTEDKDDIELASRLTDVTRRLLPALRLYSCWLMSSAHLVTGLATEDSLKTSIDQFWRVYARAVDLVAAVFPIWDLDDLPAIDYMLEEDADTIGFKPLMAGRTNKIWQNEETGMRKLRFSDLGVARVSQDEEMLARVKDFLADGLYMANDNEDAPIKLRGTRVLHLDAEDVEPLPITIPAQTLGTAKATGNAASRATPKPLSYAAAAANGRRQQPPQHAVLNGVSAKPSGPSRDAELSRMVDDLVDENESNNPVTPPQQLASDPAVVTKDDLSYSMLQASAPDFTPIPNYSYQQKQPPVGTPAGATSPFQRSPKIAVTGTPIDRLHTLSSLWNDAPGQPSSSFPAGLPTGTLSSPAQLHSRGHSRVNSASSIRSRTSQNMDLGIVDSWASSDSRPKGAMPPPLTVGFGNGLGGLEPSTISSPLLFGAGGGVWSTLPGSTGRNATPPSGQGG